MDIKMIEANDYTFEDEHPNFESLCDNCEEPSDDLEYIESGDPSVGYREGQRLCPKCRAQIGRGE